MAVYDYAVHLKISWYRQALLCQVMYAFQHILTNMQMDSSDYHQFTF